MIRNRNDFFFLSPFSLGWSTLTKKRGKGCNFDWNFFKNVHYGGKRPIKEYIVYPAYFPNRKVCSLSFFIVSFLMIIIALCLATLVRVLTLSVFTISLTLCLSCSSLTCSCFQHLSWCKNMQKQTRLLASKPF